MMLRKSALALCLALALSACATPEQRCIARETRDLRTVDRLIVETRRNLDRGYAFRSVTGVRPRLTFCTGHYGHRSRYHTGVNFCTVNELVERKVPIAIDPEAERRKLETLEAKRRELQIRSQAAVAVCRV